MSSPSNSAFMPTPPDGGDESTESSNSTGGSAVNKALAVVLLTIVCVGAWSVFGPKHSLAGWNKDWESGVAQARSTGKPAIVLFTADWCPPCRQLKSQTLSDAGVQAVLQSRFTPVVVDLTDRSGPNNQIAADYQVRGIPTVIVFDSAGREVQRTHGMGPDDFIAWLSAGR